VADLRHDFVRTLSTPLDLLDMDQLAGVFAGQAAEGRALIEAEPVTLDTIRCQYSVDMQFAGQTHLIRVPVADPTLTAADLKAAFEKVYFDRFRVSLDNIRAIVVNANTSVIGVRKPVDLSTLINPNGRKQSLSQAKTGERDVHFDGGAIRTPVYKREWLPLSATIDGPAIVEQLDTTVLIEPGDCAETMPDGNMYITRAVGETPS